MSRIRKDRSRTSPWRSRAPRRCARARRTRSRHPRPARTARAVTGHDGAAVAIASRMVRDTLRDKRGARRRNSPQGRGALLVSPRYSIEPSFDPGLHLRAGDARGVGIERAEQFEPACGSGSRGFLPRPRIRPRPCREAAARSSGRPAGQAGGGLDAKHVSVNPRTRHARDEIVADDCMGTQIGGIRFVVDKDALHAVQGHAVQPHAQPRGAAVRRLRARSMNT